MKNKHMNQPSVHRIVSAVSLVFLSAVCRSAALPPEPDFSWRSAHARVLPHGDLEWAPRPFVTEKGESVRYIDYAQGDDFRDGKSKDSAWKHHPLDPEAEGEARKCRKADTFVFKCGVEYRGMLKGSLTGTEQRPIRLTSDTSWGSGPAVITGSEPVTRWKLGAERSDIPEPEKVWTADLSFAPRAVWAIGRDGSTVRIPLARTPNWTVSDPRDVMSEWYEWEQPEWWTDKNKTNVNGRTMHLGIDTRNLHGSAGDYAGGLVWSEWGIVMGTPFASAVELFDGKRHGIGFQGFWYNDSGKIITGNRYFLEDRPGYLDSPGEYWFDKLGEGGRLYLRLPEDADPGSVRVEAARRTCLMDFDSLRHVRISGLCFRFTNVYWDLTARQFVHRDVQSAALRILGSCEDVTIRNCVFEDVNKAIRIKAASDSDRLDAIVVSDNRIQRTDHGAIEAEGSERWGKKDPPFAYFGDIKILRNSLSEIGRRPFRSDSAHALCVSFPQTLEIAGNILTRTYGSGIFVFMGKESGSRKDAPFARALIHHNKVDQPLLAANDWGGIETWQGGPFYVYNNISKDPGGYWNWAARNKPGSARLGFAYYLDGSFKNYLFNNIAWGLDNDPSSKYCNKTAFYCAVPTVLNAFFNNTVHKFREGSEWSPAGGRQLYLGNVWNDISGTVFIHGKQKEDAAARYDAYEHGTCAYSRNVFSGSPPEHTGIIEGLLPSYSDLKDFSAAAARAGMYAYGVGHVSPGPALMNPDNGDFRPAASRNPADTAVKFFVPWPLFKTVGEWHFRKNPGDPATVLDEHWCMSPAVSERETYRLLPRNDLKGKNISAESYSVGPLEDWCLSALDFSADRGTVLTLPPKKKAAPSAQASSAQASSGANSAPAVHCPADWLEITAPQSLAPDCESTVTVRLKKDIPGQKIMVHLHWLKNAGWGGFDTMSAFTPDASAGKTFSFRLKPGMHEGLDSYSLLVGLSPDGSWKDVSGSVSVKIPLIKPDAAAVPAEFPSPYDTGGCGFIVEAVFRTGDTRSKSSIVSCIGERGYELGFDGSGQLAFRVKADAEAAVRAPVSTSEWTHAIAECDREAGMLRIYLNGRLTAEKKMDISGSAAHSGSLSAGKGFTGSLEFLRIALGTLKDSHTTIEELYAWEFDGPFLRDFTGRKSSAGRPAGAVDYAQ